MIHARSIEGRTLESETCSSLRRRRFGVMDCKYVGCEIQQGKSPPLKLNFDTPFLHKTPNRNRLFFRTELEETLP